MEKKIRVTIHPDGMIEAKTIGIKGPSCKSYVHVIEELLNAKAIVSDLTSEYNEKNSDDETENIIMQQE